MGEKIVIYHTAIELPDKPDFIEDWGYADDITNQYWRRRELPSFFQMVEYDKEGNALLDRQQSEYAREEVRRCKEGFWFMNNGKPIYITGKNYFYLTFWKLEDDIFPDYRDLDRRYFLFLNHWENVSWCLGTVVGKKRRQGATSIATSNLVYECIFFKNSFCGLTSKTQVDAKTAFTNMVSFGYRQLPVFLKPKQLNNKDSVSELVFAHKTVEVKGQKGSVIDTDSGHRSKVDYRAPTLNAYDSGRLSRGLFDEMGKWSKEVPASTFLSIVSKTLVKGAKRVGFIECPSTSNSMTNGGEEFKKIWDSADHVKYPKTPNRLVKYFTPAFDGYLGFIDRYGNSVIDKPTKEQEEWLIQNYVGIGDINEEDIRLGAKEYLLQKRKLLQGTELEEEIRMNPFDEREMFMLRNGNCHFDAVLLSDLYELAKVNEKEVVEYGNWTWKNGMPFTEAIWEICSKEHARWHRPANFILPNVDTVRQIGGIFAPNNAVQFISAVDPFQNSVTESGTGSKACSGVINRYNTEENIEFFDKMIVSKYHARPPMAKLFHMDMVLQCFAYGCQLLVEAKMDGGLREFFIDNNCEPFLLRINGKTNYGIDPNADNKALMVNLWEQYILTHGKAGKIIYPEVIDDPDGGDGLLKFDVNNTEPSDTVMGLGWTLVADYYKKVNFNKKPQTISLESYFRKTKITA
jgi:hypothetical protein